MTESLSRPTSPDGSEDLAMNFVFESDVDKDIDDVVRFGAFGQFEKARSIVDESLGELDDKFFVAVEIMRLLYDQGDGMELIKYTRRLLSPDRDRNTHGSWSEMATCILHLMHDFGVILEDDPSGFVTDEVDLSTFNWPVQQFQGLDDERMLCLVLMLMAIYLTPESLGRSPVGLHSIPSSLRHERVLSELLEHLLNIRHYWAAVNILRACFSLSHVDCKAIWTSIESFVDDSSSDDDEPALLFRLGALQTFMEGLLYCDFRDPSEARRPWPSWEELMDKFHILRRSLELHCGADTWTTSQTCLRHRILNIDREVQDRSYQSRRSSDKDRKAYKKLSELRMCAETNADRRVLKRILWRTDILVSEKGSESTRHPRGTFGVPFGIYSRYHALPRGMIDVVQHDKMHSSVMFKRDDPAVPSASQLIASPSWPSPLSIHEHIVRLAEFFSIGRVFSVLWTEATRADEGDSGYGSTLSGPSDHLEKPLMDARRRFVVVEASRDFCRALPITTYTGLGVAKAGVVKSDHAIIYTGARPPEPQDNERPRRDRRETGMRLVPIRVRLDSADYKLDPMSRVNFRDVHQIPHEARVRSLGRVSRQSIDALLSQYSNVWQDQAALGPCKADSDEPRAREDVDVHGDDGDGDENSDDGQDYESDDRWKGQS